MNQLVYFLHTAVVFSVPAFFGWVLLRRVVREHDWLVLVPGSLVAGALGLMAILNEVRFYQPMASSLWTTYKLLLILALVILLATRAPRRLPLVARCAAAGWRLGLLAAAATMCAIYFGIPAFHGVLNDAWWFHYPHANLIQCIPNFPLTPAFAPDDMLYYHYGPDLLAAAWSYLLDRPVATGFALNIVFFLPASLLLAAALIIRLTRNYWSGLTAGVLLVVGGNLQFLGLLGADWSQPASLLKALNSQTVEGLLELAFTPSHALGVPAVLLGLVIFRHFHLRPAWGRAALLGLWLGMLTLLAEWYFLPMLAVIACWLLWQGWRDRRRDDVNRFPRRLALACAPLIIALAWGCFNNTYLAGIFGYFWMRHDTVHTQSAARLVDGKHKAWAVQASLKSQLVIQSAQTSKPSHSPARDAATVLTEHESKVAVATGAKLELPSSSHLPSPIMLSYQVPKLLPLRFNLDHFGKVPSWESAGSKKSSFIPIFSWSFFSESAPILLIGTLLGFFWLWQRPDPLVFLLFGMTVLSLLPPIFLDWGYRSTDFLRFFTGAHCWAAVFLGAGLGQWLTGSLLRRRIQAALLLAVCLVNAAAMGLAGLLPGTIETVHDVSSRAASISQLIPSGEPGAPSPPSAASPADHREREHHLALLAKQLDRYLFPLTGGHARVVVMVPPDQLPPQHSFPQWLKIATYARMTIPVGRHWNSNPYSEYYRRVVTEADQDSLLALGVEWIVVTDALDLPPPEALAKLENPLRFLPAASFRSGNYTLNLYRRL